MSFFCPLPWVAVYIDINGQQKICCRSTVDIPKQTLDFNHDSIRKVRLQLLQGKIPETCSYCVNAEQHNGPSLRKNAILFNPNITIESVGEVTDSNGMVSKVPLNYSLIMGNRCNLRCMMCMPECSSSWHEDWIAITGRNLPVFVSDTFSWVDDKKFINDIFLSLQESVKVNNEPTILWFSGGEVFLNPLFSKLLEKLVNDGLQTKCNISILSNGTTLSYSLEELIRKFPLLKIQFSIDGIGVKNDYIRYPSKFSVIERNITRVADLVDTIYITVSSPNVLDIDEIINWCEDREFKTHFEIVYGPLAELSPVLLPQQIRNLAIRKLERILHRNLRHTKPNNIQSLINKLTLSQTKIHLPKFWELIDKFDKRRNTNFLDIFPEWKRFC